MKEIIGEKNAFDLLWLILHHVTTVLMIISIFLIIVPYVWTYIDHWFLQYNYILARVTEQDTSVSNRVSSVSVIKYAIYNNKT